MKFIINYLLKILFNFINYFDYVNFILLIGSRLSLYFTIKYIYN